MEFKMTFPHRLKFALFFICCMQHVYASNSSVNVFSSSMSAAANSSTITQANSSTITQANSSTTAVAPTSAMSSGRAYTTEAPMAVTKKVSTASEAPATATVIPTSTTHNTTMSASAYVNNASAHVLTSSSMFTAPNVTINIRDEYSSPDCKSCSNGGTITVTKSCDIKMPSNVSQKCDKDKFDKTRCGYVYLTLADKVYRCAEVFKNYTNHVEKNLKIVKECNKECPASGSVLSPHLAFIFATGLVVGMLSQTL